MCNINMSGWFYLVWSIIFITFTNIPNKYYRNNMENIIYACDFGMD